MKLIITIPKNKFCYIQELEQGNTDYATTRMLYHAVKHGKPYLEQESCDDCISRHSACDAIRKYKSGVSEPGAYDKGFDEKIDTAIAEIGHNVPSVTSQQKYEDVAKAFHFGMAFGFCEKNGEMDKLIDKVKETTTPQPCDDAISRQEALNAITMAEVRWQAVDNVNKLPPVAPKCEVLDKIKAEIQGLRNCSCSCSDGIIDDVEDIIDKYKAESEVQE